MAQETNAAGNSKQYRISKHSTPKHRKSDLSPSESDRLKSELSMFGPVISKRYGWELHIWVDFFCVFCRIGSITTGAFDVWGCHLHKVRLGIAHTGYLFNVFRRLAPLKRYSASLKVWNLFRGPLFSDIFVKAASCSGAYPSSPK